MPPRSATTSPSPESFSPMTATATGTTTSTMMSNRSTTTNTTTGTTSPAVATTSVIPTAWNLSSSFMDSLPYDYVFVQDLQAGVVIDKQFLYDKNDELLPLLFNQNHSSNHNNKQLTKESKETFQTWMDETGQMYLRSMNGTTSVSKQIWMMITTTTIHDHDHPEDEQQQPEHEQDDEEEELWDVILFPIKEDQKVPVEEQLYGTKKRRKNDEQPPIVAMGGLIRILERRHVDVTSATVPPPPKRQSQQLQASPLPSPPSTNVINDDSSFGGHLEKITINRHQTLLLSNDAVVVDVVQQEPSKNTTLNHPKKKLLNNDAAGVQQQEPTSTSSSVVVGSCQLKLDCSNNPMVVIDEWGRILECNQAFQKQQQEELPAHDGNFTTKTSETILWDLLALKLDRSSDEAASNQLKQCVQRVFQRSLCEDLELQHVHKDDDNVLDWRCYRVSPATFCTTTASSKFSNTPCVLIEEWDITASKQKELNLEEALAEHKVLFEHLPIAYTLNEMVWDNNTGDGKPPTPIDYVTLDINGYFEDMTGLTKEMLVGKRVTEALPGIEKDPGDWINRFGKVILEDSVDRYTQYSTLLGRWFAGTGFKYSKNKFMVVFSEQQYATSMQEQIREVKERHLTLFENMKQGVVYHKQDGTTLAANESALRILGLTMEQMIGKLPMDPQWRFCREDGSTLPLEEYPAVIALSGKPVNNLIMGVYNTLEEKIRWLALDAMPRFRPGEDTPYQAYTIFNDITEAKEIEREIIRAKQKAEEADQLKSAFLACMSHEIRTPLNGIIGSLDLILSNDLQMEYRMENLESLETAMKSANLLIAIIQDVLDLSKIEAGQLDIVEHPISIRVLIEDTLRLADSLRIQKGKDEVKLISEVIDGDSIVDRIYGDQYRLQQGKTESFFPSVLQESTLRIRY